MRVLVACEFSGVVREAFRRRGHDAWSCDLLPAEDGSTFHLQMDAGDACHGLGWDLMVAHPPCTRLTNAGVRWLHSPPRGKTVAQMLDELHAAAAFYSQLRDCGIKRKAIENPVMHKHAKELIGGSKRQIVQPWWFGDPAFKATGFELIGLPPLVATNKLTPPKRGTEEHKQWSWIHRMSPGPSRSHDRSRTFAGIADAMATQWGSVLEEAS